MRVLNWILEQELSGAYNSKKKHQDIARKKKNPPALVGDITGLQSELEAIGKAATKRFARRDILWPRLFFVEFDFPYSDRQPVNKTR